MDAAKPFGIMDFSTPNIGLSKSGNIVMLDFGFDPETASMYSFFSRSYEDFDEEHYIASTSDARPSYGR